jgi:hypothetical protein
VKERICSLFTDDDARMLELSDDIDIFFEKGPGREISYRIASPLLADMLTSMLGVIHKTSNTILNARFAHAETLLPLMELLKLFPDELSLDADPQTLLNRTWASSIISPSKLLIKAPSKQYDFRSTRQAHPSLSHFRTRHANASLSHSGI